MLKISNLLPKDQTHKEQETITLKNLNNSNSNRKGKLGNRPNLNKAIHNKSKEVKNKINKATRMGKMDQKRKTRRRETERIRIKISSSNE